MYEQKTIEPQELNMHDMLTADAYDKIFDIILPGSLATEPLVSQRGFFNENGLYVKPNGNSLTILGNYEKSRYNSDDMRQNKDTIKLDDLLQTIDSKRDSVVLLIEGYAGCGKSTLVQDILLRNDAGTLQNYNLYNYNIERQNNILIRDKNGAVVRRSSIFAAISKCFINQLYENYSEVKQEFDELILSCRDSQFSAVYWEIAINKQFKNAINSIMKKNRQKADSLLYPFIQKTASPNCILALDFLLRLAIWKKKIAPGKSTKMYICYDNLDAIEDAADLTAFPKIIVEFRNMIDSFIDNNPSLFCPYRPKFVILATYRKITAVLANLENSNYYEVAADDPSVIRKKNVWHIDATSTYSYNKIVEKRYKYFSKYYRNNQNTLGLSEKDKRAIRHEIKKLKEWHELNQHLEFMKDRYSFLWNRNYRTCSLIGDILLSEYKFDKCINLINQPSTNDGYYNEQDEKENNVSCTYYGGSAILLSYVCKIFNDFNIWSDLLKLTQLSAEEPTEYSPSYKNVSLSRLILTYLNNLGVASIKDIYNVFCSKGFFSVDELCDHLSKMIARDEQGIFRRPIYYYNEIILAGDSETIKQVLKSECDMLQKGTPSKHNYSFQLCDSGRTFVERLMSEFEFFSNRLSSNSQPLYMCNSVLEIERIIQKVYNSVVNCCSNMTCFMNEYIQRYGHSREKYLSLPLHPKTNRGFYQLHAERIIFSHIAYLNNVRLFFINTTKTYDSQKSRDYNRLFVKYIRKYLDTYENKISNIAPDRLQVYKDLLGIVKLIEEEEEKDITSQSESVLFCSISLNHAKK